MYGLLTFRTRLVTRNCIKRTDRDFICLPTPTVRDGEIKATSVTNAMRDQNPTVLVTAVTEPLTWENDMDIGRGNDCVV